MQLKPLPEDVQAARDAAAAWGCEGCRSFAPGMLCRAAHWCSRLGGPRPLPWTPEEIADGKARHRQPTGTCVARVAD